MALIFRDIVYGPVHSRRLGLSLGVNLLPLDGKLCSFECIYCECGWSEGVKAGFNSQEDVAECLWNALKQVKPDVITFAGNGEPTMHPDFEAIIEDTTYIRDYFAPNAKISVLTNGMNIGKENVHRALMMVDNNIVKLDSAFDSTARLIDNPKGEYSIARQVERMKQFNGKLTIQTLFLRGEYKGQRVDNTTEEEVSAWLKLIKEIKPQSVMVYTLDRPTPATDLEKVSEQELERIRERVRAAGIKAQ